MTLVNYETFDLVLQSNYSGATIATPGGKVFVAQPGTFHKAVLYDPDNNFVALANPLPIKNGKIRFALLQPTGAGTYPYVDIYGITGRGHSFTFPSAQPGNPSPIQIYGNSKNQELVIPFSALDCTPGTEVDTGFAMPANCLVTLCPAIVVTILEAGRTLSFGTLSTQAGGAATAFGATLTCAALGGVKGSLASPLFLPATAPEISYTLSAGSTVAEGLMMIPYLLSN